MLFSIISVLLGALAIQAQPLTKPAAKSNLRLLVIDQKTGKRLSNREVKVYSDNGIRCITAPCPTNGKNWVGKTDRRGYLVVPADIRQESISLTVEGFAGEELNRSARKLNRDNWVIALKSESK